MAEYIERETLLESLDSIWDCNDMTFPDGKDHICSPEDCKGCKWHETVSYIKRLVVSATAANVAQVEHAAWRQLTGDPTPRCTACGANSVKLWHGGWYTPGRCPECGARMGGEDGTK